MRKFLDWKTSILVRWKSEKEEDRALVAASGLGETSWSIGRKEKLVIKEALFSVSCFWIKQLMTDRETEVTMEVKNETTIQEFVLEGFPAVQHLGKFLFLVHLLAYLASITGNMVIITITWVDHRLQTPMYIFLSTFSFCESCFITTVIPTLLSIFLSGRQTIPFTACLTQAFAFLFLGSIIFFLMAVMSLDRHLAICKPLRYPTVMNLRVSFLLVFFCYTLSFIFITGLLVQVSQLSFCGPNVISHFFCDLGALIHLSCSDTRSVEIYIFFLALLVILIALILTFIAYSNIIVTIVRLPSAKERQKAFSTCLSHLIVLSLMYGSCVFTYVKPKQTNRLDSNREAALVNTVVTLLLNPVIYTLQNKQIHQALRKTLSRMRL
uniref:G-protein coupled receptors family 1 profile domain-containing protein n=3 Tax=Equus caballus TaxID=9796 RepID=A0A3Q2GWP0_HORSE